jgi:hypothetical protein
MVQSEKSESNMACLTTYLELIITKQAKNQQSYFTDYIWTLKYEQIAEDSDLQIGENGSTRMPRTHL